MTILELEEAVLKWINDKYADPVLSDQISHRITIKREYSGAGFFTHFEVPNAFSQLPKVMVSPISGPYLRGSGLESEGGSLLFHANGYLTGLECYANGQRFDQIGEFELFDQRQDGT